MSPGEPPSEPAAPRVCTKRAPALRDADPVLAQLIDNRPDFDYLPSQQEVLASADTWRPYQGLAASYLFSTALEPAEAPPAARHRSARP